MNARQIVVSGGFDDLRSRELRFLEEASKLGEVTVLLWPDAALASLSGKPVKFPFAERFYLLSAIRYVSHVLPVSGDVDPGGMPDTSGVRADVWVDRENPAHAARKRWCDHRGLEYRVIRSAQLAGFPETPTVPATPGRRKVVATGCYDWLHSGHVRFCEEVSAYGDLYVIVGHDANVRLLKGEGHPLFPQEERRYLVGSIRFVKQALISSGSGWLDADPEIRRLKPDIYAVNEDGDQGGKREYCRQQGMEYLVLRRGPAPGLPRRTSTELRGF